jgi:exopolyphosphatase/guanosine-5'-triphosphate,3'-diphosphate pyrophosphatase
VKVAVVDIGTNTVRLLLADAVDRDGAIRLEGIARHEVITKLGEGLDASGKLGSEPMDRALAGLELYVDLIAGAEAAATGGVATAATRSAANGAEFIELVTATLGFRPRVIDGVEEARLTYLGATASLDRETAMCVIDVGGGSTEFVVGYELPEYAASIDIGSVRLTERIEQMGLHSPDTVRAYVDGLFEDVVAPVSPSLVLGSGGTFVTLGAVARGVPTAEVETDGVVVLSFPDVAASVDQLLGMSVAEIAALPSVPAARAEVLKAGVVCAERAVAHVGASEVRISVADILDGIAMELAARQWPGDQSHV